MDAKTERLLLRVPEAAELVGLSRARFYKEIQRGAIRTVKIGTAVRIPVDDLRAYVERLKAAAHEEASTVSEASVEANAGGQSSAHVAT